MYYYCNCSDLWLHAICIRLSLNSCRESEKLTYSVFNFSPKFDHILDLFIAFAINFAKPFEIFNILNLKRKIYVFINLLTQFDSKLTLTHSGMSSDFLRRFPELIRSFPSPHPDPPSKEDRDDIDKVGEIPPWEFGACSPLWERAELAEATAAAAAAAAEAASWGLTISRIVPWGSL